jgi:hypothetical protein
VSATEAVPSLLGRLPRLDVLRPRSLRVAAGITSVVLLVAALRISPSAWAVWIALLAPDLPGLAGAGAGLAPKQMHPRAVTAYNATHRLTGGVIVLALAGVAGAPTGVGIALAWLAHVLLDRAVGYTLRTPDGFLRR